MVPGGASSRSREIVSFDIAPLLLHLMCRSNRLYAPHSVVRCGSSFRRKATTARRSDELAYGYPWWLAPDLGQGRTSSGGFGGQYLMWSLRSSSSSVQRRTSPHSRSRQPIRGGV